MKTQTTDRSNFFWPTEKKERISKFKALPLVDLNVIWTCTGIRWAKATSQEVLSASVIRASTPSTNQSRWSPGAATLTSDENSSLNSMTSALPCLTRTAGK